MTPALNVPIRVHPTRSSYLQHSQPSSNKRAQRSSHMRTNLKHYIWMDEQFSLVMFINLVFMCFLNCTIRTEIVSAKLTIVSVLAVLITLVALVWYFSLIMLISTRFSSSENTSQEVPTMTRVSFSTWSSHAYSQSDVFSTSLYRVSKFAAFSFFAISCPIKDTLLYLNFILIFL